MTNPIYLDNNATTRPFPEVTDAMMQASERYYANPSSAHPLGQEVRHQVDLVRDRMARWMGADRKEIIFTSGGTEAIGLAILGTVAAEPLKRQVVISTVEHPVARQQATALRHAGYEVREVPVDNEGALNPDRLEDAIQPDTALVSLLWANHETGVLTDVKVVREITSARDVPLHLDGVQAVGKLPVNVRTLGVDLLSFSAHKFHGPKGIGGLYVRKGHRLVPHALGGPQEFGLRAGTENVPAILALGTAIELVQKDKSDGYRLESRSRVLELRDRLELGLQDRLPGILIHGRNAPRVPNTSNVHIPAVPAEALLIAMGEKGIHASAGAACSSGSLQPSSVLLGMGFTEEHARCSIRFSLSRFNTAEEIDYVLEQLPVLVQRCRLRAV